MTIGNTQVNNKEVITKFNAAILKLPDTSTPNQVESMISYLNQYVDEINEKGERLEKLDEEIRKLCKRLETLPDRS